MIVVELGVMTDECELIVNYDMVVRLGKGWFWINRYVVLIFGACDQNMWAIAGKHAWY